jgi:hypothetical protein
METPLSPMEQTFLLWAIAFLLAIIAFIGAIFVHAFLKLASDVNEIKGNVKVATSKHDGLEKRVERLELKFE